MFRRGNIFLESYTASSLILVESQRDSHSLFLPMLLAHKDVRRALLVMLLAMVCLRLKPDVGPRRGLSDRMRHLPARTLWVWERSEDLSGIDPSSTAIAWLDQTILISDSVTTLPRRQPFMYPAKASRIAVVRIEVQPGTSLEGESEPLLVRDAVSQVLVSAAIPGISALQIDFDATRSQRGFYTDMLRELRSHLPVEMPLSITALASWCSYDDWIGALPIDEAVPMFFRMEPDRRRAPDDRSEFRVRESLCMSSVGISTHERWPSGMAGKRIYIFADRGWRQDMPLLTSRRLP